MDHLRVLRALHDEEDTKVAIYVRLRVTEVVIEILT